MAARNPTGSLLANRFANKLFNACPGHGQASSLLRSIHNASESVRPGTTGVLPDEMIDVKSTVVTVVPDEVNQTKSGVVTVVPDDAMNTGSEKYWTPNPETGVFVPDNEHSSNSNNNRLYGAGDGSSVLDQTACIRHVEVEEVDNDEPFTGLD